MCMCACERVTDHAIDKQLYKTRWRFWKKEKHTHINGSDCMLSFAYCTIIKYLWIHKRIRIGWQIYEFVVILKLITFECDGFAIAVVYFLKSVSATNAHFRGVKN